MQEASTQGSAVASPVSTGGGGEQFEQHVAALALSLLLVRGTPPILTDTSVAEVRFQTRHQGWRTDDLLVIGERSDGSLRRLALQVKRKFRVSARDEDCRKTISGMWSDFQSDLFDESRDRLAVVTLHGTSVLLEHFVPLLECARASIDANDFTSRLGTAGYVSKKAKEHNLAIRQILTDTGAERFDEHLYWRFLRAVNLLSYDLNTETSQTKALVVSLLAACTADGSGSSDAAQATWAKLLECASQGRSTAKAYTRETLPADLRRQHARVSGSDRSGLTVLVEHGHTVRDGIRSVIGQEYAIDRSIQVQSLAEKLAKHQRADKLRRLVQEELESIQARINQQRCHKALSCPLLEQALDDRDLLSSDELSALRAALDEVKSWNAEFDVWGVRRIKLPPFSPQLRRSVEKALACVSRHRSDGPS